MYFNKTSKSLLKLVLILVVVAIGLYISEMELIKWIKDQFKVPTGLRSDPF
jgi:uncharacterized membrane protein